MEANFYLQFIALCHEAVLCICGNYGNYILLQYCCHSQHLQGGRGHWTVNYTGTQSFKTTSSNLKNLLGCDNFSTNDFDNIQILYVSSYRSLSYPLSFLNFLHIIYMQFYKRHSKTIVY